MDRKMEILHTFWSHDFDGATEAETNRRLEGLQIRGAFKSDGSYVGYDYRDQRWIEEEA